MGGLGWVKGGVEMPVEYWLVFGGGVRGCW